MGDFERDTAVRREHRTDTIYVATIDHSWWVVAGPNGGYVAAILVRALTDAGATGGDDATRPLRSLTVHYLRPPAAGPARVHVAVERACRSVSYLSARLEQDGRPCALALAVLATDRDGALELHDAPAPQEVARPDEIDPQPDHPDAPPFGRHFDFRPARGGMLEEDAELWSEDGELLAQSRQLALAL